VGSIVLAYLGPDGTVVTQVIMGLQQFDARTGVLSALPDLDKTALGALVKQASFGFTPAPTPISADKTIIYVSPH